MNTKLRIKQRREERIRRLMDGATEEIMQERELGSLCPVSKNRCSERHFRLLQIYKIIYQKPFSRSERYRKEIQNGYGKKKMVITVLRGAFAI